MKNLERTVGLVKKRSLNHPGGLCVCVCSSLPHIPGACIGCRERAREHENLVTFSKTLYVNLNERGYVLIGFNEIWSMFFFFILLIFYFFKYQGSHSTSS